MSLSVPATVHLSQLSMHTSWYIDISSFQKNLLLQNKIVELHYRFTKHISCSAFFSIEIDTFLEILTASTQKFRKQIFGIQEPEFPNFEVTFPNLQGPPQLLSRAISNIVKGKALLTQALTTLTNLHILDFLHILHTLHFLHILHFVHFLHNLHILHKSISIKG